VLDGHRLIVLDPSNLPLTSPTSGICERHISATDGTLHLTPKQTHVLKEPNGHSLVSEQKREKKTCSAHRLPPTAHVRTKTLARAASPATVVRTAEQFLEYVQPLSQEKKMLHNNTNVAEEE
jgi:hypothetical protein